MRSASVTNYGRCGSLVSRGRRSPAPGALRLNRFRRRRVPADHRSSHSINVEGSPVLKRTEHTGLLPFARLRLANPGRRLGHDVRLDRRRRVPGGSGPTGKRELRIRHGSDSGPSGDDLDKQLMVRLPNRSGV